MIYILIYIVVVVFMLVLSLKWPGAALACVLCNYPLGQWMQATTPYFVYHIQTNNFVMTGIVLCALLSQAARGGLSLSSYPRVGWLTLALLGLAFVSISWTTDPAGSYAVWVACLPRLIFLVLLSPLLINAPVDVKHGLIATLGFGSFIIIMLLLTTKWENRGVAFSVDSTVLTGGNPLVVATLGAEVALIALLSNFRGAANVWRPLRWGLVLLGLIAAFKSGSRGPTISLFICATAFLPMSRRIKDPVGFLGVVAMICVLMFTGSWVFDNFVGGGASRWNNLWDQLFGPENGRFGPPLRLLSYWLASPTHWPFGLGNSESFNPVIYGYYTHNVPIEILCEEGIAGAALGIAILVCTVKSIRRLALYLAPFPEERGYLACLCSFLLLEIMYFMVEGNLLGAPAPFALAIMIARFERGVAAHTATEATLEPTADGYYDHALYAQPH